MRHATPLTDRATDGVGLMWDYVGTILDAAHAPNSEEGPNENDLALLDDGKTILCVIRVDGGDGPVTHHMLPYVQTVSTDGGATWSPAVPMRDTSGGLIGCARPRLLGLTGGGVVLSGGRLDPQNHDNYVWINAAGDAGDWEVWPHQQSTRFRLGDTWAQFRQFAKRARTM